MTTPNPNSDPAWHRCLLSRSSRFRRTPPSGGVPLTCLGPISLLGAQFAPGDATPARSPSPEPFSWAASLGPSRPARCSGSRRRHCPKGGLSGRRNSALPRAASQLSESVCFLVTRPRPVAGGDGLVRGGLAGGRSAGRLDTCRGCAGSLEPPAAGGSSRDRGRPGAEGPQRPPISSDCAAPSSPPSSSSSFLLSLLQLLLPTLLLLPLLLLAIRRRLLPVPPAPPRDAGARGAVHRARGAGSRARVRALARDGGEIRGPRRGCARGPATPSRWRHGGPGVPRETAAALCGECPGANRGDRGRHFAGLGGNGSCLEGFVAPQKS